MEKELCMTRIDWVEESTQSVWNFWGALKTVCYRMKTMLLWMENNVEGKTRINR